MSHLLTLAVILTVSVIFSIALVLIVDFVEEEVSGTSFMNNNIMSVSLFVVSTAIISYLLFSKSSATLITLGTLSVLGVIAYNLGKDTTLEIAETVFLFVVDMLDSVRLSVLELVRYYDISIADVVVWIIRLFVMVVKAAAFAVVVTVSYAITKSKYVSVAMLNLVVPAVNFVAKAVSSAMHSAVYALELVASSPVIAAVYLTSVVSEAITSVKEESENTEDDDTEEVESEDDSEEGSSDDDTEEAEVIEDEAEYDETTPVYNEIDMSIVKEAYMSVIDGLTKGKEELIDQLSEVLTSRDDLVDMYEELANKYTALAKSVKQ